MSAGAPPDSPVVLVKWYDYAKWVLERVESFPKNQKYVLGQRLSHQVMEVLELLVEASYSREKRDLLATVNRKMEVVRWTVRMCKDRNLLSTAQFTHSARCLNECGKMVGGWWKAEGKKNLYRAEAERRQPAAGSPTGTQSVATKQRERRKT